MTHHAATSARRPPALKKGDHVEWSTSQGRTDGTVVKKVTSPTHVQGHPVKASPAQPQYEVASRSSGKHAVHKPGALTKRPR